MEIGETIAFLLTGIGIAISVIIAIGLIIVFWIISGLIVNYLTIGGIWSLICQISLTLFLLTASLKLTSFNVKGGE